MEGASATGAIKIPLVRWAEAGAPRFMGTDHPTEKYPAIYKKREQIGSILVAKREQFAPNSLPFCSHFHFLTI